MNSPKTKRNDRFRCWSFVHFRIEELSHEKWNEHPRNHAIQFRNFSFSILRLGNILFALLCQRFEMSNQRRYEKNKADVLGIGNHPRVSCPSTTPKNNKNATSSEFLMSTEAFQPQNSVCVRSALAQAIYCFKMTTANCVSG